MTSRLRIEVRPNPSGNDHEATILVDEADWLGADHIGLDPPMLAAQFTADTPSLLIGRCACGCVGCGDVVVEVVRREEAVEWVLGGRTSAVFERDQYESELARFAQDRSWEPIGRRVEREVEDIFRGAMTDDGLAFHWASTRIQAGLVHLSFSRDREQRLLEFSWDDATLETALDRARLFHRERFENDFG